MYAWIDKIVSSMGSAISEAIHSMGSTISNTVFDSILQWLFSTVYGAVAEFFSMMGNMGAEIFELDWVRAVIVLFSYFGWALFAVGVVVSVFDTAIEYQNNRGNIKATVLNILKGFFACSLIGTLPMELYRFCISLQNTLLHGLIALTGAGIHASISLADICKNVLSSVYGNGAVSKASLFTLLSLIALAYCVIKVFAQNIKRGGILLIQIVVGSLYMFSVPRGYTDGFVLWIKQVIATCLTAFLQTVLLQLGLLTFQSNMLLGLGIMLAANEVPRIAQQFGLDSSVNVREAVSNTTTAVNISRTLMHAG